MSEPVAEYLHAAQTLASASSAIVCGHVDPDGDAVGSVLGLTLVLRSLGIEAHPVLADDSGSPETYAFLPGFHALRPASELQSAHLFIALDTPNFARLGPAEDAARAAGTRLVIDHHPDNAFFGDVNLVDASAAAAGQIVWRLLPLLDLAPDTDIALCLYVAMLTDTGRFQYSNANAGVLRDAAAMVDHGIDMHAVSERVYENQSLGHLAIVGCVKHRVTLANDGHVAYSWVTDADFTQMGAAPETTENLVDAIRVLGGVDSVFLVKETDGTCKVSLRGKGGADVGSIARRLGGGGHAAAAGFTYMGGRQELLAELLALLPGAKVR